MKPTLVDVFTACQIIDIKRTKIYELMNGGLLRSVKIGRARRIFVDSIEELIGREVLAPGDGVWKAQKQQTESDIERKDAVGPLYSQGGGLIRPVEDQVVPPDPAEASKRAIFFSETSRDGEK